MDWEVVSVGKARRKLIVCWNLNEYGSSESNRGERAFVGWAHDSRLGGLGGQNYSGGSFEP
jgi:hypothetical protein